MGGVGPTDGVDELFGPVKFLPKRKLAATTAKIRRAKMSVVGGFEDFGATGGGEIGSGVFSVGDVSNIYYNCIRKIFRSNSYAWNN